MKIEWLGRIEYQTALRLQEERLDDCWKHGEESVLLFEHEPVYTIGRLPDKSSLRIVDELPHPVFETNRGGQATYHGPGQLVGYPILDLRTRGRDLHCYLRKLEDLLIDLVKEFEINGERVERKTGVWIRDRKIASIGVGVRKWVAMVICCRHRRGILLECQGGPGRVRVERCCQGEFEIQRYCSRCGSFHKPLSGGIKRFLSFQAFPGTAQDFQAPS
jgi:hypothetical protein